MGFRGPVQKRLETLKRTPTHRSRQRRNLSSRGRIGGNRQHTYQAPSCNRIHFYIGVGVFHITTTARSQQKAEGFKSQKKESGARNKKEATGGGDGGQEGGETKRAFLVS